MRMKVILEQMLKGTGRFASEADQMEYIDTVVSIIDIGSLYTVPYSCRNLL